MERLDSGVAADAADIALLRLRAALAATPGSALSIVVDPMLADPLAESPLIADAFADGRLSRHRFGFIHDDFPSERMPYLLHVDNEPAAERCVNESVAIAVREGFGADGEVRSVRSVCAWILGDVDPEQTAHRLAAASRIARPDGSPWPMRFWDPRVFWHLPRVLPSSRQSAIRRAIGQWCWLDPMNAFSATSGLDASSAAVPRGAPAPFDGAEWAALQRIGAVNRVLGVAWEWGVLPTTANAERIDRLLQRCHELGFQSEQDELVFCSCALTSRDDFDRHPPVDEALRQGASEGRSVAAALASFDDGFWQRLAGSKALGAAWSGDTS